jgi:hypothetical protein
MPKLEERAGRPRKVGQRREPKNLMLWFGEAENKVTPSYLFKCFILFYSVDIRFLKHFLESTRDSPSRDLVSLLLLGSQLLAMCLALVLLVVMVNGLKVGAIFISLETHVVQAEGLVLLKGALVLLNGHGGIGLGSIQVLEVAVSKRIIQDQCALDLEGHDLQDEHLLQSGGKDRTLLDTYIHQDKAPDHDKNKKS